MWAAPAAAVLGNLRVRCLVLACRIDISATGCTPHTVTSPACHSGTLAPARPSLLQCI